MGAFIHNELWISSEEQNKFNSNIIGQIEIVKVFAGESFAKSANDLATQCALKYLLE